MFILVALFQALQDLDLDPSGKWDQIAASKWILDRQMSDGGWEEEPIEDGQVKI